MAHRESKDIDDLIDMRTDEMGSQDELRALLDHHFEAIDALGDASGRVPGRGLLRLQAELEPLGTRLLLAEPDRCDRWNCEGNAWDGAIIGTIRVALEQIGNNDLGIVAGDWGQWRPLCRSIAGGIDCRFR